MIIKNVVTIFLSYFILQSTFAIEHKDATLRDEDISSSLISVEYFTRPDGLMEYVYTISSSLENKGEIDTFLLDLLCTEKFDLVSLPYADGKPGYEGGVTLSEPAHTPVAVHADYGSAASYGITENNAALWGIGIMPGKETTGLRLISAAKPGMRLYEVEPWVDYDESWQLPEDLSLVPKAYDFRITGMIAAPGCPGVTEPPAVALFAGSGHHHEPENINKLLQYGNLDKNRFHVDKDTKEFEFHIYYSDDVDAKTFKVKPGYLKDYFNPIAGTNEKVTLPLKKYRNKIKLSVHSLKKENKKNKEKKKDKHGKSKHGYKDTDKFEIRASGKDKHKHKKHSKNKHHEKKHEH